MSEKTQKAIQILKNGGVVIFPTDTAVAIGCRIDSKEGVKRIFEIRKRPENKPLLVLVDSVEMAKKYLLPIPRDVKSKIIDKYWPGKLTIVLDCLVNKVPAIVRGNGKTLGVRFPNEKKLLEIIKAVGVPIVAPSANLSGDNTPFKFEDLNSEIIRKADFVLNESISSSNDVSTIIDCSVNSWNIIRQGAVRIKNSELKIKNCILMLDTSDSKKIVVGLENNGEKLIQEKEASSKEQIVLQMIDEVLNKHPLKPEDLTGISINLGPGSYTGLRVGIAIANALSFALRIPINGKPLGEKVFPIY